MKKDKWISNPIESLIGSRNLLAWMEDPYDGNPIAAKAYRNRFILFSKMNTKKQAEWNMMLKIVMLAKMNKKRKKTKINYFYSYSYIFIVKKFKWICKMYSTRKLSKSWNRRIYIYIFCYLYERKISSCK